MRRYVTLINMLIFRTPSSNFLSSRYIYLSIWFIEEGGGVCWVLIWFIEEGGGVCWVPRWLSLALVQWSVDHLIFSLFFPYFFLTSFFLTFFHISSYITVFFAYIKLLLLSLLLLYYYVVASSSSFL